MAQGDIYTTTPGSAVADTIQEILARRRADSRQAMLDQLESERVHSAMSNEDKRTGFEGERVGIERSQADEAAKTGAAQRDQLRQAIIDQQLGHVGEGADLGSLDPEVAANARKYGLFEHQPGTTPMVSDTYGAALPDASAAGDIMADDPTQAGPQTSGRDVFRSQKQSEAARQEQDYANYLAQHPEIAKDNPELAQVLSMNAAGVQAQPSAEMLNPAPTVIPISPEGKKEGAITGPRGATFMPRPYAPTAPSAYITPQQTILPNPKDNNKLWTYWLKPGEGMDKAVAVAPYQPGVGKSGSPDANDISNNSASNDKLIQASNQLRMAMQATGANHDAAVAAAKAAVLASRPMSQGGYAVLNDMVDSFGRAQRPPTVADIPAALSLHPELAPQDQQSIREILTVYLSAGQ